MSMTDKRLISLTVLPPTSFYGNKPDAKASKQAHDDHVYYRLIRNGDFNTREHISSAYAKELLLNGAEGHDAKVALGLTKEPRDRGGYI